MGDVNLEIKLGNLDERVIKIEESGGGSGGDGYITSVSNDFNVVNKKLSLSNDVTTKLSKVDINENVSTALAKKIDKPASATDGQVLTYNGTSNEWEAKNQSASITEPTNLEKGIIGGDKWVAQSYTKGATVIYNNKIYSCIADCAASNEPTDSNYWEETSISELKGAIDEINDSLIYSENETVIGSYNGKPLYRKVFKDVAWNVITNSWTTLASIANVETIITLRGILKFSDLGYQRPIPLYESASFYAIMDFQNGNIVGRGNGWNGNTVTLIAEYTKI